jgi:hypothetical protein
MREYSRTTATAAVLILVGLVTIAGLRSCTVEKPDIRAMLASETTRVDYEDGVSCYHRGSALSCTYVPTRAPMGPVAPAVLMQDIVEPDTDIVHEPKPKPKKRKP